MIVIQGHVAWQYNVFEWLWRSYEWYEKGMLSDFREGIICKEI